jgi:hypothetical protein
MSADRVNVNPLAKIVRGVTHENVYRRVGWLYVSFALLFVPATVASHYLLPEGILRGKHPIIRALQFSPNVWLATLQICAYNLIPTALIVGANLLAQRSRFAEERYVPIGYTAFWGLTVLYAVVLGTWSFEVAAPAPPLGRRLLRVLDVTRRAGLLEFSAYLLAAATSYKFTLRYSDRRQVIASRKWGEVRLTGAERALLALACLLLLGAAHVESRGIIQWGG